jgi:hypothetical protein
LYRAFEHIPDVQLAADLFNVDGFSPVRKSGVAGDDERAADARQVGSQAFGYAVDEIILLGTAADVRKRQLWFFATGSRPLTPPKTFRL